LITNKDVYSGQIGIGSKGDEIVLSRRNMKVTPDSTRMWFKRHSEVLSELKRQIFDILPTQKEEVNCSIFQRSSFENLPSVKNWAIILSSRELAEDYSKTKLNTLRNGCMGKVEGLDLVAENECVKHPDRFILQDAMQFVAILKKRNINSYRFKRDLKDFLQSKAIVREWGLKYMLSLEVSEEEIKILHF
jgi:hypothetical protein